MIVCRITQRIDARDRSDHNRIGTIDQLKQKPRPVVARSHYLLLVSLGYERPAPADRTPAGSSHSN